MNLKKFIAAASAFVIVCGAMPVVQSYVPDATVTAHAADYEKYTEGDITHRIYDDHAVAASCNGNTLGSISIPASVNNLPVTEIGERAFVGCQRINKIVIPDSVKVIKNEAFIGCSGAKTISIGKNVESIGSNAFPTVIT